MIIKLVGFDPALSNLGIALFDYDTDTEKLTLQGLKLVQTEATSVKTVRKNSDDLQRAKTLYEGMVRACEGRHMAIAEIPVGTQSARGAMSNGIALGVMAACPLPLIQVMPREVKMAAIERPNATKAEMIEWAVAKYPHKDWLMRRHKGVLKPINDNEHLADACAVVEAGIATEQFKSALVFLR